MPVKESADEISNVNASESGADSIHSRRLKTGLGYALAAGALAIGTIVVFIIQVAWLMKLTTPWYLPVCGAVAALLAAQSFALRRTVLRFGLICICLGLVYLEWTFITQVTMLPEYRGEMVEGNVVPIFRARAADGSEVDQSLLRQFPFSVIVFYQGRWCPFCMTQLRELNSHSEYFDKLNTQVLAVSLEDVPTVQQTQMDFPKLTLVSDADRQLSEAVGVITRGTAPGGQDCDVPTILIMDNAGFVRWFDRPRRFIDRPDSAALVKIIQRLEIQ